MSEKNIILICGRLGKNPELKYTKKQEAVCNLAVAEQIPGQEKPKWHKVVVWGRQAECCSVQLKKGAQIFARGRNQLKEFTNNQGEKKQYSEFIADLVGFPML